MCYHGVGIRQASPDVLRLEIGVIRENGFVRFALSQEAQNQLYGNSHTSDNRLAAENILIGRDTFEEILFFYHKNKIP